MCEDCAICYEKMKETGTERTRCQHEFHYDCLQQWFKHADTCPICREPLRRSLSLIGPLDFTYPDLGQLLDYGDI